MCSYCYLYFGTLNLHFAFFTRDAFQPSFTHLAQYTTVPIGRKSVLTSRPTFSEVIGAVKAGTCTAAPSAHTGDV